YAGAYNPLYLVRSKEIKDGDALKEHVALGVNEHQLFELKGDRQPISIHAREKEFNTRQIQLMKGDALYLFTDGFTDQIGGPNGKKFLPKNFKKSLLSIQDLNMSEQKTNLEEILSKWKGRYEQVDDILVMGIKI
ncbi:MAG: SpoIIE family protein phosphatase, partial [Bacteroidales bacterium]|nr:SpoIIE family protein phosphatase [Bacteroidales bacterium]